MNHWFTSEDARNLVNHGFKLFEFDVTMYQVLEHEIAFCRKGIIQQKEIELTEIWDLSL